MKRKVVLDNRVKRVAKEECPEPTENPLLVAVYAIQGAKEGNHVPN